MKALRTLILGLIFVILLVFVYLFEIKPSKAKKLAEEKESKVFFWKPDSVKAMEVNNAFGSVSLVKDSTGKWNIISPISYLGDEGNIKSMLETIGNAKWIKTLMDTISNPDEFGLRYPAVSVMITLFNDSVYTLKLGDPVPTGENYYAVSSHSRGLRIIPGNVYSIFNRSLDDFRDRKILEISSNEVERFTVKRKDTTIEVFKDSSGIWQLGSPIKDKANAEYVNRLLTDITTMRAQKFVAEDTSGFAKYGFKEPKANLTLTTRDGSIKTLLLGDPIADNKDLYYLYYPHKRPVFAVQKSMIEALLKPVDDFRSRQLITISPEKIEIVGDTSSVVLAKISGKWMIVHPESSNADESKISMLVSDISGSIVDSFVKFDKGRFSRRRYILVSGSDTTKKEKLIIGDKKGDNHAYAQLEGRNETFLIPARIYDHTNRGASYFIERKLFPVSSGDIATIAVVDSDGVNYKLVSSPEREWSLVSPKNIRMEDLKALTDLFTQFKNLQFYTKKQIDKPTSEYGFDKPSMRITMETTKGERIDVKIGSERGPYYYAYVENSPYVYEVSSIVVNNIRKWFKEVVGK